MRVEYNRGCFGAFHECIFGNEGRLGPCSGEVWAEEGLAAMAEDETYFFAVGCCSYGNVVESCASGRHVFSSSAYIPSSPSPLIYHHAYDSSRSAA